MDAPTTTVSWERIPSSEFAFVVLAFHIFRRIVGKMPRPGGAAHNKKIAGWNGHRGRMQNAVYDWVFSEFSSEKMHCESILPSVVISISDLLSDVFQSIIWNENVGVVGFRGADIVRVL